MGTAWIISFQCDFQACLSLCSEKMSPHQLEMWLDIQPVKTFTPWLANLIRDDLQRLGSYPGAVIHRYLLTVMFEEAATFRLCLKFKRNQLAGISVPHPSSIMCLLQPGTLSKQQNDRKPVLDPVFETPKNWQSKKGHPTFSFKAKERFLISPFKTHRRKRAALSRQRGQRNRVNPKDL